VYGVTNVLVKLSDYGISQFVATQGARGLVGTPAFMAPEMLKYQGKEVYIQCAKLFHYNILSWYM
jgi:serine/threonine protein kinase